MDNNARSRQSLAGAWIKTYYSDGLLLEPLIDKTEEQFTF